jgi:hypothetical protein
MSADKTAGFIVLKDAGNGNMRRGTVASWLEPLRLAEDRSEFRAYEASFWFMTGASGSGGGAALKCWKSLSNHYEHPLILFHLSSDQARAFPSVLDVGADLSSH